MTSDEPTLAFDELLTALGDLRVATSQAEVAIRRAIEGAEQRMDTLSVVSSAGPAVTREGMNDALKALETARHRARLAVFASALDDGVSIGELGRTFGFSRQLAARYAKEARGPLESGVPSGRRIGHAPGRRAHLLGARR